MVKLLKPSPTGLDRAIQACVDNGYRLCEETYDLEFRKPPASRLYFAMIAQEEFAKAFILFLVRVGVVPFTAAARRAINDHTCKQLVGMIMDYMIMHWDDVEELNALIALDIDVGELLPNDVGSALEILRYEKIAVWEGRNWVWGEDPNYDPSALRVAEGKRDQRKQDALYVRIGRDGQACSTPGVITEEETQEELERAKRYGGFVMAALEGTSKSHRFDKAMAALRQLFAERPTEHGGAT